LIAALVAAAIAASIGILGTTLNDMFTTINGLRPKQRRQNGRHALQIKQPTTTAKANVP
jgi:hypothetical protein